MMSNSLSDLAYCGGLFDGEGCVTLSKDGDTNYRLKLHQLIMLFLLGYKNTLAVLSISHVRKVNIIKKHGIGFAGLKIRLCFYSGFFLSLLSSAHRSLRR